MKKTEKKNKDVIIANESTTNTKCVRSAHGWHSQHALCFLVVSTKLTYFSSSFVLMFIFIIQMNDKLEELIHENKTPGLNKPETYVLMHNRFKNYMVFIFSELNEAQIYKRPYRDRP